MEDNRGCYLTDEVQKHIFEKRNLGLDTIEFIVEDSDTELLVDNIYTCAVGKHGNQF